MREYRGVGQGDRILPGKSQSYRDSQQYLSASPGKSLSYQARIQCWAIIGPPAKRLMAFRRLADGGPAFCGISILSFLFNSTKNAVRVGTPLTKLSRSAHGLSHVLVGNKVPFSNGAHNIKRMFDLRLSHTSLEYEDTPIYLGIY